MFYMIQPLLFSTRSTTRDTSQTLMSMTMEGKGAHEVVSVPLKFERKKPYQLEAVTLLCVEADRLKIRAVNKSLRRQKRRLGESGLSTSGTKYVPNKQ